MLQTLESEVATLIVEGLDLDVDPAGITPDSPIFGDGLGLDSIDALELGLLLSEKYHVTITPGDKKNHEIFSSLRALSQYVEANRQT